MSSSYLESKIDRLPIQVISRYALCASCCHPGGLPSSIRSIECPSRRRVLKAILSDLVTVARQGAVRRMNCTAKFALERYATVVYSVSLAPGIDFEHDSPKGRGNHGVFPPEHLARGMIGLCFREQGCPFPHKCKRAAKTPRSM